MNNQNSHHPGNTSVQIDEQSYMSQLINWQGRKRKLPLSAYGLHDKDMAMFVTNEVLVDPTDRDLINELVQHHGATVVPSSPIPLRPDGLGHRRKVDLTPMPLPVLLRLSNPPRIDSACSVIGKHISKGKEYNGNVTITSDYAAKMIALVGEYKNAGRPIGLNMVGNSQVLPLSSATENHRAGNDPFKWKSFSGKSRIIDAWQLVESYRQIKSLSPRTMWVGILDSGFWLDGAGFAYAAPGQSTSDLGTRPLQLNLLDESAPAGGASGIPNGENYEAPWHGNGCASAATATVGNLAGASGAGGTVANPVLFKTDASISQIIRCLHVCLAWGVDVLNMSISISYGIGGFAFPKNTWENQFRFASDNGLIIIAAAGNDDKELPDHVIRPATRTPGVITVGALDVDPSSGDYTQKASFSNYGSSIGIWAPGTNIPVIPNDLNPNGDLVSGTSIASPLVAGVAAMMRYVDHSLNSDRIRQILWDTGWQGTDGVAPCMDAYAAVFACMGNQLPADSEPNDNPAQARELMPMGNGIIGPTFNGYTTLTRRGDTDWWIFHVKELSTVTITGEWYQRLSNFSMELNADDPDSRAADDIIITYSVTNAITTLSGPLSAGTYRIRVTGSGSTAYRLQVQLQPLPLAPDMFEPNDSFATATRLIFKPHPSTEFKVFAVEYGPGTFEATLHNFRNLFDIEPVINNDYYRLEVPGGLNILYIPAVKIWQTDFPVDVTLYDSFHNVINQWLQVRSIEIKPERGAICFLKISGSKETRYNISVRLKIDKDSIPGPLQEEDVTGLPPWWGDPMLKLKDRFEHYFVDAGTDFVQGNDIVFQQTTEALALELLDLEGNTLRQGNTLKDGRSQISTDGLQNGKYVLRVSRESDVSSGNDVNRSIVNLNLSPPF